MFFICSSDDDEIEERHSNTISAEEIVEQPKLFQLGDKISFITDKMAFNTR